MERSVKFRHYPRTAQTVAAQNLVVCTSRRSCMKAPQKYLKSDVKKSISHLTENHEPYTQIRLRAGTCIRDRGRAKPGVAPSLRPPGYGHGRLRAGGNRRASRAHSCKPERPGHH